MVVGVVGAEMWEPQIQFFFGLLGELVMVALGKIHKLIPVFLLH